MSVVVMAAVAAGHGNRRRVYQLPGALFIPTTVHLPLAVSTFRFSPDMVKVMILT